MVCFDRKNNLKLYCVSIEVNNRKTNDDEQGRNLPSGRFSVLTFVLELIKQ